MSPLEFMQRLAALAPRPRLHLIRFHGVLAPNARLRSAIVPGPASVNQPLWPVGLVAPHVAPEIALRHPQQPPSFLLRQPPFLPSLRATTPDNSFAPDTPDGAIDRARFDL